MIRPGVPRSRAGDRLAADWLAHLALPANAKVVAIAGPLLAIEQLRRSDLVLRAGASHLRQRPPGDLRRRARSRSPRTIRRAGKRSGLRAVSRLPQRHGRPAAARRRVLATRRLAGNAAGAARSRGRGRAGGGQRHAGPPRRRLARSHRHARPPGKPGGSRAGHRRTVRESRTRETIGRGGAQRLSPTAGPSTRP